MKFKMLTLQQIYPQMLLPQRKVYGIYHGSEHYYMTRDLKGNRHLIVFNLDFEEFRNEPFSLEEYVSEGIRQLNATPKSPKDNRSLFGNLVLHRFKILEKNSKKFIQVMASSDEHKNKMLWRFEDEIEKIPNFEEQIKESKEKKQAKKVIPEIEGVTEKKKVGRPKGPSLKVAKEKSSFVSKVSKICDAPKKKRGRPPKAKS